MCKNNKLLFILFLIFEISIVYGNNNNQNIIELGDELNYKNVKFIKNETFEKIKNIFASKELSGEFKYMDLKKNTYYREKYLEVLKMKEGYINGNYEGKFDKEESKNKAELIYYFFDMNGDNIPELIADNSPYTVDIFTYEINSKKVKKIVSLSSGTEFLGGNKIYQWYGGIGEYEHYLSLDSNGNFVSESIFYSGSYPNENNLEEDKRLYTIGCGDYTKQFNKIKNISKEKNEIVYYNNIRGGYFFRITEEQSNELMSPYIEIRKIAENNIKKVTYTYDELFGEFDKTKKIVLDISTWTHPTKSIVTEKNTNYYDINFENFEIYKGQLNLIKIEITNKVYPIFYFNNYKEDYCFYNYNFLSDIAEKNGYWDYEIILKDDFIKVFCDKKQKRVIKIESSKVEKEFDNLFRELALKKAEEILVENRGMIIKDKEFSIYDDLEYGEIIIKNYGFNSNGEVELRISTKEYILSNIAVFLVNIKTNNIIQFY